MSLQATISGLTTVNPTADDVKSSDLAPSTGGTKFVINHYNSGQYLFKKALVHGNQLLTKTNIEQSLQTPTANDTQTLNVDGTKDVINHYNSGQYLSKNVLFITEISDLTLSHSLSLSQSLVLNEVRNFNLSHTITLSQLLSVSIIHNILISQSITLDQTVLSSPKAIDISQSITLSQLLSEFIVHNSSISQSINLDDSIFIHQSIRNIFIDDSIILNQSISESISYIRLLSDLIILDQSVDGTTSRLSQVINHHIDLDQRPTRSLDIGGEIIYIPNVDYSLKPRKCLVILACKNLNIVLPCPLFGDSEANVATISTRRTMTGQLYSYSKGSNLRKLSYRFLLERNKSIELLNFLKNYMSDLITMINWKGEKFLTYITNNPINMITKGLWRECGEYQEVQLDFEGTKINNT